MVDFKGLCYNMFCEKKTKGSELCLGENLWFFVKCFVFKILSSWAAGVVLGRIDGGNFVGEYMPTWSVWIGM